MWEYDEKLDRMRCRCNFPYDNKVNNFQAVQWVSEFCENYNYNIVVTSTWRMDSNYKECLINAGLRKGIEILGATPVLHKQRGDEITVYLKEHPEITNYLIFDDESDMTTHMDRLVKCKNGYGFGQEEYNFATILHHVFNIVTNSEWMDSILKKERLPL